MGEIARHGKGGGVRHARAPTHTLAVMRGLVPRTQSSAAPEVVGGRARPGQDGEEGESRRARPTVAAQAAASRSPVSRETCATASRRVSRPAPAFVPSVARWRR